MGVSSPIGCMGVSSPIAGMGKTLIAIVLILCFASHARASVPGRELQKQDDPSSQRAEELRAENTRKRLDRAGLLPDGPRSTRRSELLSEPASGPFLAVCESSSRCLLEIEVVRRLPVFARVVARVSLAHRPHRPLDENTVVCMSDFAMTD
jgi:hypothetical protein